MTIEGIRVTTGMIITIAACSSENLSAMIILGSLGASLMYWGAK